MVRAKFRVTKITTTCWGQNSPDSAEVFLTAVIDDANKTWSKYTPGGELRLNINNPAALEQFKVGEFYFLDFTVAPAKEADEVKGP